MFRRCNGRWPPPEVERAPFATVTGLTVAVAAGDCVNLRQGYTRESPVVACLPNGTRLYPAQPPSVKGELQPPENPNAPGRGRALWWYVRTDQGLSGWVFLSAEYLTWSVVQEGEP